MYNQEELLPLITRLMGRYTSKESSSVTYETANMLAEAVVYCIDEWIHAGDTQLTDGKIDLKLFYSKGYEAVIQKVKKAGELYNTMLDDFRDYGCRSYRETILDGMPAFFLRYDAEFNPQDHLLTLDYPTYKPDSNISGVDRIYEYLLDINMEREFLAQFPEENIRGLLLQFQERYRISYPDNICELVILQAVGCIIAERPVSLLRLDRKALRIIRYQFEDSEEAGIEREMKGYIRMLCSRMVDKKAEEYFAVRAGDYAVRIRNGMENGNLEEVFMCEE
ncbi:DUF6179 domain-containing protein [Novisyntrophococcus fermenticellae]|uniref:DUF6179 domain-containing protein n=1 Tax=Novisyntrophococcus fermenticellae TaxID=2068655 RepID=UPI001E56603B|nr:DUF6179 domain-containing protein [Novisyntrophococcus fermenticellae]